MPVWRLSRTARKISGLSSSGMGAFNSYLVIGKNTRWFRRSPQSDRERSGSGFLESAHRPRARRRIATLRHVLLLSLRLGHTNERSKVRNLAMIAFAVFLAGIVPNSSARAQVAGEQVYQKYCAACH